MVWQIVFIMRCGVLAIGVSVWVQRFVSGMGVSGQVNLSIVVGNSTGLSRVLLTIQYEFSHVSAVSSQV
jgi:hypothetical protein